MKRLFLFLIAAVALSACKKDNENTPNKTDLLVAKNWRISAQTNSSSASNVNNGAVVTTDIYATSPACERDNFTKFNATKTAVFDEGATKCDPSDPQTQSGTWDFNSDQTKLTLVDPSLGGLAIQFDVVELSSSKLQLRYTGSNTSNGVTYTRAQNITFAAF